MNRSRFVGLLVVAFVLALALGQALPAASAAQTGGLNSVPISRSDSPAGDSPVTLPVMGENAASLRDATAAWMLGAANSYPRAGNGRATSAVSGQNAAASRDAAAAWMLGAANSYPRAGIGPATPAILGQSAAARRDAAARMLSAAESN